MKTVDYKVPGGKLLRIQVEFNGSKILLCRIFGDFFMHPEEKILNLEQFLVGQDITQLSQDAIAEFLQHEMVEVFGFAAGDLLLILNRAYENL